tara:strand:+ start:123 stop:1040 length:918 start_codon:yes stop_codon:yes gene_type:complete
MQLDFFADNSTHKNYFVTKIDRSDTENFILNLHYAKKMPSISYAFGLFDKNNLVGVVTYGNSPSSTLAQSIAGKKNAKYILELNRLVLLNNKKNEASILVSKSLKMLPSPKIIVSFADEEKGHYGYVYQATNFLYTGNTGFTKVLIDKYGNDFHYRNIGHLQKNNSLNVNLEKVRINEDNINKRDIANFLKKYKKNYTNKELDILFATKDTAAHWFRTDAGFSFPSIDNWTKLKTILNFPDTFDQVMTNYDLIPSRQEIIKKLELKTKIVKPKHRYIYLIADKRQKKQFTKDLKLNLQPYPKCQK